ncbi:MULTISPECIES: LutB/LldF family L-lactate oxidation iron-sulfur protein [Priestia]|jgi:L-lactate dehydrogenase complex protein LldF|uniref:Lactate utilization protein B n=2 Tax=Priestia megaterium TaxID=1404 RepID=D5DZB0_PRIM1|nr:MULTISPECIES: LutB/LldF family L-lactate oxidation iron-sulfur protein [Priestia]AVX07341.1 iron-sulfur cluster-binding protein [Bacillus sp. Y-01]KOP73534.1 amino acid dehydrogenase [Bacillus sp. FJAT-21351]KQU26744.1 amino acid dehydrogenase [Bacillus sp. Leaf75]KRF53162.1 amino acid dehydrogenase [Bacillus sp. Soil531]MBZ5479229.1 iron-sulfur cluster-binding protein [Bacillus sp. T_4]MCF6795101.1 LutB/LldF family L-lactate oxidation iron-sulfur protein [Bacillus sp. ET1]MDH6655837.1 L-
MSMKIGNDQFKKRVDDGVNNAFMRFAVSSAQERLRSRRLDAAEELGNWEEWRALGEEIRQHTLENLDYYLEQLTDNVAKRGGHVFFAQTAEEANEYIKNVARKKQAKKVVKSKSMVTEEIHMNAALEELGCEVIETDLGEYILQVDDHDPPSHIVAPALHKNKEQIRDVFQEKLSYKKTEKPEELALHAREMLRKEFLSADIGITGCNFAIAESGSISLVTNEGNARLTTALPKTQITVMGMERIVPTFEEFEVLVSLLTRSAVGQRLTSYVTALTGPRLPGEVDGPEEFHLVIVDNGRSAILGTEFQSVLQCIRCAACVNVCPVYRHIGGHSYGSIYSGPIGAVLSPLLGGYEDYKELPYASTLCAACTDACPVKIPLHELLHKHRQRIVEKEGKAPISEKLAMKAFGLGAASSSLYTVGAKVAPAALTPFMSGSSISKGPGPLKAWTESREFPAPTKERLRDWFDKRSDDDERKHSK